MSKRGFNPLEWRMTESQHGAYLYHWGRACAHQGWTTKNGWTAKAIDAKRKEIHTEVFGSPISAKEIDRNGMFGRIKHKFLFLAGDLNGAQEVDNPEIDERRRLLDVIADHFKCARVYDPTDAYLKKVLAPRFKIADGWHTIEDLNPEPTIRKNWKTGKLEETPSELMQCVYTIARCVNDLRNKNGDTGHEMCVKAKVFCKCAQCAKYGQRHLQPIADGFHKDTEAVWEAMQPVLAGGPDPDNEPF